MGVTVMERAKLFSLVSLARISRASCLVRGLAAMLVVMFSTALWVSLGILPQMVVIAVRWR